MTTAPTLIAVTLALFVRGCGPKNAPPAQSAPSEKSTLGGPTSAPVTAKSGVHGLTAAGPTCPVAHPGMACADRPFSARVTVTDASGQAVTSVVSGADGTFDLELPPGTYSLTGTPLGNQGFPRSNGPVSVTVEPGQYATVELGFDTGIR